MLSDSLWTGSTSPVAEQDESTSGSCIEKHDVSSCQSLGSLHGSRLQAGCGAESSCSAGCTETDQITRLKALRAVVGFHGRAGVGKTTSAKMTGLPLDSFAEPIRDFATSLFGEGWQAVKDDQAYADRWHGGLTPRKAMQSCGENIRAVCKTAFVDSLVHRIDRRDYEPCAIHDVRHLNERDAIHSLGGVVIGLTDDPRGIHNGKRTWMRRFRDWVGGWFRHKTERAIPCDVWVVNDRGEDYQCRMIEAARIALAKRNAGLSRLT